MLVGKGFSAPVHLLAYLPQADNFVVQQVHLRQFQSDFDLLKHWYRKRAKVNAAYRKRCERLQQRLAQAILMCTISSDLSVRQREALQFHRSLSIGETLFRLSGRDIGRKHLHDALKLIVQPDQAWFEPGIYLKFALDYATNGERRKANDALRSAHRASAQASLVTSLYAQWIELAVPARSPREQEVLRR